MHAIKVAGGGLVTLCHMYSTVTPKQEGLKEQTGVSTPHSVFTGGKGQLQKILSLMILESDSRVQNIL